VHPSGQDSLGVAQARRLLRRAGTLNGVTSPRAGRGVHDQPWNAQVDSWWRPWSL